MMNTFNKTVLAMAALLTSSTVLLGCEDSVINEKTGVPEKRVMLEDGVADDVEVSGAVELALQQEDKLRAFNLQVETRKGDVTLKGEVDTKAQRMLAEQIARSSPGAHTVNNEITVRQQ
jgi:hyperosmotically inducible periplasmic protein